MENAAVLLCAGSSMRMKGHVEDKALVPLLGKPAMLYSLESFIASGTVNMAAIVTRNSEQRKNIEMMMGTLRNRQTMLVKWVEGGIRRQDSVANALEAIPENMQSIFIHDCARPLIRFSTIRNLSEIAAKDKAVCLAHRMVDTIKEVENETENLRLLNLKDCDRTRLWAMETPQVFERTLICDAYRRAQKEGWNITDDTSAVLHSGHRVTLLETPYPNPKLTVPEDIAIIEHFLANAPKPEGVEYK